MRINLEATNQGGLASETAFPGLSRDQTSPVRDREVVSRKAHNLEIAGSIPAPATMKTPEQYIWLWATKGFEGITALVEKYLGIGVPPTNELRVELMKYRDRLNAILERIG